MAGARIKAGATIPLARIIDLVTTACHLLDIPAPTQAEGSVLWLALKWDNTEVETTEALAAAHVQQSLDLPKC